MAIAKYGFDNEKYLREQSAEIKRRAEKYGKLYLEFGGKLMNDNHAARCLPGYDPNVKLRLLQMLGDKAELVLCIYAGDIEAKKMRADYGTTYEEETLKLVGAMKERGITVRGVAITRFDGHPTARAFAKVLEDAGVPVFYHYPIKGYPNDLDTIVSDSGYGRNDYIPSEKPIVVVTGPGPGSGKFATCLTMLYHEVKRGNKAAYAKFETFPVWDLQLMHPLNVAYEAATLELKDENQIDPHHFLAYGEPRHRRLPDSARDLGADDGRGVPLQVADGHGREPHLLGHRERHDRARGEPRGVRAPLRAREGGLRRGQGRDGHARAGAVGDGARGLAVRRAGPAPGAGVSAFSASGRSGRWGSRRTWAARGRSASGRTRRGGCSTSSST